MAIAPNSRGMGALPSPADHRDVPLDLAALPVQHAALPASIDLRPMMPPIWDQSSTNACTAYASTAAAIYQRRKQGLHPDMPAASKTFTYWYTRCKSGLQGRDGGAYLRDAFKSLANEGLVQEQNWPDGEAFIEQDPGAWWQSVAHPWTKPPYTLDGGYVIASNPETVGQHHRLATYRAVPLDLNSILLSLANRFAVVIAMNVYESFWSTGSGGMIPTPNPASERYVGSHAVVLCGYDQQQHVTLRNSWSSSWAQNGYGYVAPDFFSAGVMTEAWTVHAMAG